LAQDTDDTQDFFTDPGSSGLLERFDAAHAPQHVAIIMDGNGRWARARNKPRIAGHRAGAKALREAIRSAIELGVRYLTIYSFSSENWRRPPEEVRGLMRLFVEVLQREMVSLIEQGVRLRLVGRRSDLPDDVLSAFVDAEERTGGGRTLDLLVALNYGGRQEIVDAVRSIADSVADGTLSPDDVDEGLVSKAMYTGKVPDPDLVIRTSGEMRLSNFLLWQIAYSELWITDVLWPDFSRYDLLEACVDYQARQRRFGA
jgi:undecaprenyl diphosphate synthase